MAAKYTDYTRVGENYRKKAVSAFVTGWFSPTNDETTNGIVLGYLPENSLVTSVGIINETSMTSAAPGACKVKLGGQDATVNKLYTVVTPIELKGTQDFAGKNIMVVIEYIEVARSTGDGTLLQTPTIASDGTEAV